MAVLLAAARRGARILPRLGGGRPGHVTSPRRAAAAPPRGPTMKFQDYYETLGVPRTASAEDIKRSYRKLALKWHPDRHKPETRKEAEERFKRISEAYEVLSDPEKRGKYDQFGEHWKQGQEFTPPPGAGGARRVSPEEFARMFGGGAGGGFSEFFTNLFGDRFESGVGGGARGHAGHRA